MPSSVINAYAVTLKGEALIDMFSDELRSLYELIETRVAAGRARALALTKLEELAMWTTQAVIEDPDCGHLYRDPAPEPETPASEN